MRYTCKYQQRKNKPIVSKLNVIIVQSIVALCLVLWTYCRRCILEGENLMLLITKSNTPLQFSQLVALSEYFVGNG